jgi:hypothetical protein
VKGILTRDNIKDVVSRYPEQVRAIQQGLEAAKTSGRSRSTRRTPGTTKEPELMDHPLPVSLESQVLPHNGHPMATASASLGLVRRQQDELRPERRPVAAESPAMPQDRGAIRPPASTIDTPGRSRAPESRPKAGISSVTHTPSRLETLRAIGASLRDNSCKPTPQVTRTQVPGASTFADMAPSQVSNADSIPEIRRKRKAAPGGSALSSVGQAGAEFKRTKGTTKREEPRPERFRDWLKQQKVRSSAPQGSSAP